MNTKLLTGILLSLLSILLSIAMMATYGWVNLSGIHFGLINYKTDNGESGSISSLPGFGFISDAGTYILGFGITGILIWVVSTTVLLVAHRKLLPNYRLLGILGQYIASAFLILGAVLYAQKLNAGYSFIIMIIAGFLYFTGSAFLITSGWLRTQRAAMAAERLDDEN